MTDLSNYYSGWKPFNFFPLERAYLCIDCNIVSEMPGACPSCGSKALLSLGTVLNRTAEQVSE